MMNLKEMFQLSDRGAKDLKKGIFACTLTNLSLMLSVVITVQIFWEVLTPLTGGVVSWSKMWMLFGAGVVAVVIHFLCCKNDYRKTYVSCYTAAEDSRIRIAEAYHAHSWRQGSDRKSPLTRQRLVQFHLQTERRGFRGNTGQQRYRLHSSLPGSCFSWSFLTF